MEYINCLTMYTHTYGYLNCADKYGFVKSYLLESILDDIENNTNNTLIKECQIQINNQKKN